MEACIHQFTFDEKKRRPRELLLMTSDFDFGTGLGFDLLERAHELFDTGYLAFNVRTFAPGLTHRRLSDMSWGKSIRHLCGFEREGLMTLFMYLRDDLVAFYPRSPVLDDDVRGGKFKSTSSLFFRLFVVLYLLRTGSTLRSCSFVFGWSAGIIGKWLTDYIDIMHATLAPFRRLPTQAEQRDMAFEHAAYLTSTGGSFETFHKRLDCLTHIDKTFHGVIGAIDVRTASTVMSC